MITRKQCNYTQQWKVAIPVNSFLMVNSLVATSWLVGLLVCSRLTIPVFAGPTACPTSGCPAIADVNLTSLTGQWETVYYTRAEGERNADVPHFFNISLCGTVHSEQCADSKVCYSDHLQTFYSLGQAASCQYEYVGAARQVRFSFNYEPDLVFGSGNVTVTLVCGRTLGVPEVLVGDPNSHTIDIVWVTSSACRTSSSLAPDTQESKCYHVHPYTDNGLKATFIDLTGLIRSEGYIVSFPERPAGKFNISICRPLKGSSTSDPCAGSMACVIQRDPGFYSNISLPVAIGKINGSESSLHMENGLLTVVYSVSVPLGHYCFDSDKGVGSQSVKIHFLCPAENEDIGPRVTFLDDHLCLMVIHWYTSYACGNSAIQTSGCTLTTNLGLTFDLNGLSNVESITDSREGQVAYRYEFQICSTNSLLTGCGDRSQPIRVTQFDSSGQCRGVLGIGDGKLRYVDGDLSLTYGMGDSCHSNFARTTVINFICPVNVASNTSVISFLGEEDCFYQFEWVTPLACGVQSSGVSSCQFESLGGMYNLAPLVGTADKNWVALDTDDSTECFMINPCGSVAVTSDPFSSYVDYCNARLAPVECAHSSVCQVKKDGTFVRVGYFDFGSDPQNTTQVHSVDSSVITVTGDQTTSNFSTVVHYVCKVGDLTTPPIFIGLTNNVVYEFHWMTYAACPAGTEVGSECTVTHHSTGFVFNLTSLPLLTFSKDGYMYTVSVCKPLLTTQSSCSGTNTTVCQSKDTHHFSLGQRNSSLVYEDGTLKLRYTSGDQCHHEEQHSRISTLLFICDSTAHTAVINDITEDYCDYVIEVRTKLACPPAYRSHSCLFFDHDNHTYDFSSLSRASQNGNWEAIGRDGSLYFINVCQPLNAVVGCSPLAAVCRVQTGINSKRYSNTGLASSANFTSLHYPESSPEANDGLDSVTLKYEYKNPPGVACPVVTTLIKFACDKIAVNGESGPTYLSGGDDANPCEFIFSWKTVYACPVQPIISRGNCSIQDPSGYVFDLAPLGYLNSTQSFFSVASPAGHHYHISVCTPLNHSCANSNGVAVCQEAISKKEFSCGLSSTRTLIYFDGSLKMSYTGGDRCRHNNKNRSVLINFECDRTLTDYKGSPHFLSENEDCGYTFDWPTPLACLPREIECVAAGGQYDLRPLLQQQVWDVKNGINDYTYKIGGCRSLDFSSIPQCPQKPWMGACRYHDNTTDSGAVLGYVTGDIVEESENSLLLTYHNGQCSGGRKGVVYITFHCGDDTGVPQLTEDNEGTCVVRMEWTTIYACSRDGKASSSSWVIKDPVTQQVFNLSTLPHSLSRHHADTFGTLYNYTVGLRGYSVPCKRDWKNDTALVGVCQERLSVDSIHNTSHPVHSLGHITKNTTLQYVGGVFMVEYTDGDECHHVQKLRKSVVTFECDHRESFLEVSFEIECEYTFVIHTHHVCQQAEDIGIPCYLQGYSDLEMLSALTVSQIPVNSTAHAYLSVCGTLKARTDNNPLHDLNQCQAGAAACLINQGAAVNLGKPSHRFPVLELPGKNGVLLKYIEGDDCRVNGMKYSTALLLVCNRNIPVGAPEYIDNDEEKDCKFFFRWESIHACHINLPYSKKSDSVCAIDDQSSKFVFNFTNLVQSRTISAIDSKSNTTYYIQLCGNSSTLPSAVVKMGCAPSDTGVCRKRSSDNIATTVVKASHRFAITSHSPHTIDVHYDSGSVCGSDSNRNWEAVLSLECSSRGSSTVDPIFQRDDDCTLTFVWQNSSFCVAEESCSVAASDGTIYNLDGLFVDTWSGIVAGDISPPTEQGSTFTMSVCRNLNPFTGSGSHCSSPSGICWHSAKQGHVNLGHMTSPPVILPLLNSDPHVTIQVTYTDGDICDSTSKDRYQTNLFLHCAEEISSPILSRDSDASNQNGCSWTVAMETPLACPQKVVSNISECVIETSAGRYDFSPLGSPLKFSVPGNGVISVCLCKSSACLKANISQTVRSKVTDLGTYESTVQSSTTGGPRLTFVNGASCASGSHIQTIIFMECDRQADYPNGNLFLTSLSDDCHKYFFWSTPLACISEEISCSIATDTPGHFYDFSPLHSNEHPWSTSLGNKQYFINICGPIVKNTVEGCGSESSICMKDSNDIVSLGRAATQRILSPSTGGGYVPIVFSSDSHTCGSHVTLHMECGVGGITALAPSNGCTHSTQFSWKTPYACGENKPVLRTSCDGVIDLTGDSHFEFHPQELQHDTKYSTTKGVLFYVNLCGQAVGCAKDISVCDSFNNSIASYNHQTIMAEGYQLLFEMSLEKTHAIVRVVCLVPGSYSNQPSAGTLELENVGTQNNHTYYYFVLYTKMGCWFNESTTAPPTTHSEGGTVSPAGGSVTAVVLVLLATVAILTVVMVIVLYKKKRRVYMRRLLEKLIVGKADEPVKYHRLSRLNREEETGLMQDGSDDSDSGEGGSAEESGGGQRVEVDLTMDSKETKSDEEMITL